MASALRLRLLVLVAANGLLLCGIRLLLKEEASFRGILLGVVTNGAPTLLAALGLTGIICAGAIDLSIGGIVAVSGAVFGILAQRGVAPAACFAACMLSAMTLSTVNGLASRWLRMPAILWTLAGRTLYRGLALILADSAIRGFSGSISVAAEAYHAPGKVHAAWIALAGIAAAVAWELSGRTPRLWLALGNSEDACRLQGLAPGRILVGAFAAGGVFLGLAALVLVTQVQAIEPARLALGFELPVIGAVVLGGTNVFGGEGSYLGTILGAFFLHFLGQILVFAGVSVYWREVVSGAAIVLVIGLDCLLHRRAKRLEELE